MITTWGHDPGIVSVSNVLLALNDALSHSAVLVQVSFHDYADGGHHRDQNMVQIREQGFLLAWDESSFPQAEIHRSASHHGFMVALTGTHPPIHIQGASIPSDPQQRVCYAVFTTGPLEKWTSQPWTPPSRVFLLLPFLSHILIIILYFLFYI